jgi:F-type H+-transporting ATPase subunit b
MMRRALAGIVAVWLCAAFAPAWASAAEAPAATGGAVAAGEHHTAGHAPHINWVSFDYEAKGQGPPLLFALVNFAVLVFLLVRFAGPPLKGFLANRHISIKSALEEGARLRLEAQTRLAEYADRIAGVDREVDALIGEIRSQAEAEKKRILDQAAAQAAALERDAKERIAAEIARARKELEREVVTAAVAAAEKLLRQSTRDDDQRRLVDGFLSTLDKTAARRPPEPRS